MTFLLISRDERLHSLPIWVLSTLTIHHFWSSTPVRFRPSANPGGGGFKAACACCTRFYATHPHHGRDNQRPRPQLFHTCKLSSVSQGPFFGAELLVRRTQCCLRRESPTVGGLGPTSRLCFTKLLCMLLSACDLCRRDLAGHFPMFVGQVFSTFVVMCACECACASAWAWAWASACASFFTAN